MRQFERTIARLRQVVLRYMPEAAELLESLAEFMAVSLDDLNEIAGSDSLGDVQRSRHIVTGMVEMNAGLSMMVAQAEARPCLPLAELGGRGVLAPGNRLGVAWSLRAVSVPPLNLRVGSPRCSPRRRVLQRCSIRPHTLRNNSTYDDWHDSRVRLSIGRFRWVPPRCESTLSTSARARATTRRSQQ